MFKKEKDYQRHDRKDLETWLFDTNLTQEEKIEEYVCLLFIQLYKRYNIQIQEGKNKERIELTANLLKLGYHYLQNQI